MKSHHSSRSESLYHFLHERFIWLLIATYVLAAWTPALGIGIRKITLAKFSLFGELTTVTLPMVMLSLLLVNAGLGVPANELKKIAKAPLPFALGLTANLAVPLAFIYVTHLLMSGWHNAEEIQNILVGLALVASMPIAGSSTAWVQNANGNVALSLGLVIFSTLLSPLTTPLILHSVGNLATGDYGSDLHELAEKGTTSFLAVCVIIPSLLGILGRIFLGNAKTDKLKSKIKLLNLLCLLLLVYSNASLSLPGIIVKPDLDFLGLIFVLTTALCVLSFFAGWAISRSCRQGLSDRISLMFGLGMNNNGTGLVLASLSLVDHPLVMLPILFYNLVQHLIAGLVDKGISLSLPKSPA